MRRARSTFACFGCRSPARDPLLQSGDLGLAEIGQQQVVAPHQVVADRHELAEHLAGDSVTPT